MAAGTRQTLHNIENLDIRIDDCQKKKKKKKKECEVTKKERKSFRYYSRRESKLDIPCRLFL